MKYLLLSLCFAIQGLNSMALAESTPQRSPALIPQPLSATFGRHSLSLSRSATLYLDPKVHTPETLSALLSEAFGGRVSFRASSRPSRINLLLSSEVPEEEGYRLSVTARGITLVARTTLGLRHGIQTLRQLSGGTETVRHAEVSDAPRYAYRGLMLDTSRHFFDPSYIKSLLREMAYYKLNRFHWHIVDGGGWRLESKHYPLLTERAAYRTQSDWDAWWHGKDRMFTTSTDPKGYGGFYTQAEVRDIVQEAERLGITIIPEIELPGHSTELYHAYPNLICPGATAQDATDVCIGSEETFTFFERILDEVLELFPSRYIHIGGDEASMNHWGQCPRCQERMRAEGLKDLHELQSYMIKRIERYLQSKGRKLIGWDEILMGGLAPEATVMSWRGEVGGITAAKAGHDVIMTPNANLYLDYYQSVATDEPRAIGGYVPLDKVYNYNPTPEALESSEQKHVLGVQGNLWTEYITSPEQASYMLFPRLLALAEVAWSPLGSRNYPGFQERVIKHLEALESRGHKPYQLSNVTASERIDSEGQRAFLTLHAERPDVAIHYTTDGSTPTTSSPLYRPGEELMTRDSLLVKANTFLKGQRLNATDRSFHLDYHKGLRSRAIYNSQWHDKYPAQGVETLKDGLRGTPTYLDGKWQGFTEPLEVTFDLLEPSQLSHIAARFMAEREQWVYMPKEVEVLISLDGETFQSLGTLAPKTEDSNPRPVFETFDFHTSARARYVRLRASIGRSAGHFIFCDEVVIH